MAETIPNRAISAEPEPKRMKAPGLSYLITIASHPHVNTVVIVED